MQPAAAAYGGVSEINQYDTTTTTTSIDHQVHSSHDHFPYFHPPIHTHTTHQFHLFHHPLQPLQDLNQDLEKQQEDDSSSIKQQQQLFWWPRAEVQALIGVRSSLEVKFREPGLKGPVWEEVSSMMAAMGFNRSAKRCKEKWENINKYFRKAKESGKQRPVNSKTCPYFHQLDELYSKSSSIMSSKDKSELLDDIVLSNENLRFKSSIHGEYEEEEDEEDDDEEKCES
ncbi:hypothetical protein J5N97_025256 [Dioscorea zingiberensis]|uniref:Myb-like domain-containing protein n=1 Tax=Dioscorea zingiberensis TaxID=325984 RepID=A0A9D5C8Y7_9LILI|nr:hypothetical protein J5N97_025256 [Dioscorea zingiberensis]